jgi:uncharacterized lipoprotein YajG
MKKILLVLFAIATLTACTKEENTLPTTESETILVRVESVSNLGSSTYSEIVSIKIK